VGAVAQHVVTGDDALAEKEVVTKADPPAVPTCTTLCLWEPDPVMMIRKAKGQEWARKGEYAAEDRRGARKEASQASDTADILAFEEHFAVEIRACRETEHEVVQLEVADAETPAKLHWWLEQITMLHGVVAGSVHFLPYNTREKYVKQIAAQEASLKEQRERLAPKKKFGFKNRGKISKGSAAQVPVPAKVAAASAPEAKAPAGHGSASAAAGSDSFTMPAGCQGFRDRSDATLVREAGEATSDFALSNLTNCNVRLLSTSRALWIRGLKGCTVYAVPVGGSIYLTECHNCTIVIGSRQMRMHTSTDCSLFLHVASHPIIEHCSALRVAPYPELPLELHAAWAAAGLQPDKNSWNQVDDFDWLKQSQSPNWSVMADEQAAEERLKLPSLLVGPSPHVED